MVHRAPGWVHPVGWGWILLFLSCLGSLSLASKGRATQVMGAGTVSVFDAQSSKLSTRELPTPCFLKAQGPSLKVQ